MESSRFTQTKELLSAWFIKTSPTVLVPVRYVIADVKRNQRAFFIGSTTVFLLVAFVAILQNTTSKSPYIFLKLSENQVGEYDLLITPTASTTVREDDEVVTGVGGSSSGVSSFLVNQTHIDQSLYKSTLSRGSAARWVLLGDISPEDPLRNISATTGKLSSSILFIDTVAEQRIGLGRQWERRPLESDECYASESILRSIGVPPNRGMKISLQFSLNKTLDSLGIDRETLIEFIESSNITSQFNDFREQNGDELDITIPIGDLFPGLNLTNVNFTIPIGNITSETVADSILSGFNLNIALTVVDGIEDPLGKYPLSLGNVIILESKYALELFEQAINATASQLSNGLDLALLLGNTTQDGQLGDFLEGVRLTDYAFLSSVQYTDRMDTYIKTPKEIDKDMIRFTNDVSEAIGVDFPASFALPLVNYLTLMNFVKLFLDQIFAASVVLLTMLGCGLIFSLMISDVSEKTFEYGMLRTLGMKNTLLVNVMIAQSLFFAVPGVIFGLLVAYFFNIPLAHLIASYSYSHIILSFTVGALVAPIILGIFIPLFSNIVPTSRSLSKSLRDALDIYHQSFNETSVKMIRLEDLGLSGWQTSSAIIMVIMGFVVYYLMPLAFTFNNLALFLSLLNAILLGMVLGFALISQTVQPVLERFLVYVFVWANDRRLISLIHKQQSSHGDRNIKTALMFTIALAFIIFAGSMFSLQTAAIVDNVKLLLGADIAVISTNTKAMLDETLLREFLETQRSIRVQEYTFVTYPIGDLFNINDTEFGNIADYRTVSTTVFGVERQYLDVVYSDYYLPAEVDESLNYKLVDGKKDAIKSLYDNAGSAILTADRSLKSVSDIVNSAAGSVPYPSASNADVYKNFIEVLTAEGTQELFSVRLDEPLKLRVKMSSEISSVYLCKGRARLRKIPGFFMSSYPQFSALSPVIMTMDQYDVIMKDVQQFYASLNQSIDYNGTPPKQRLLIRMKKDATPTDREVIVNGVRNLLGNDTIIITDTITLVETTSSATGFILLFFNVVAMIAIALCFFMLWLSFTANMRDNFWEFGVLRSIGLPFTAILRTYIYEALCLLTSSVLLSCIIGIVVAITLTLQFNIFTELPFRFTFPTSLFVSVVIVSYGVALLGSYIPANSLREKQIALVLRGVE